MPCPFGGSIRVVSNLINRVLWYTVIIDNTTQYVIYYDILYCVFILLWQKLTICYDILMICWYNYRAFKCVFMFFGKRWALFMVCQCVWNSFVPSRCRNMYRSAMVNRWLFLFNHPKYGYTQFHKPQIVWYTYYWESPIILVFLKEPLFSINNISIYRVIYLLFSESKLIGVL